MTRSAIMARRAPAAPRSCRSASLTLLPPLLLAAMATTALAQSRIRVLEEPGGTAVGVALVINAGNALELRTESGVTHMAALAAVEEIRPAIRAMGGQVAVTCNLTTIDITLATPADTWAASTELLFGSLLDRPVGNGSVEIARHNLLRVLDMEESSPSYEAEMALQQAVFGPGHRWAGPPCGRVETVAELTADQVRRAARARFSANRMTAAVAGPVDAAVARQQLERALGGSTLPVLVAAPAPGPGSRNTRLTRNTVTSWLGMAFPFGTERARSQSGAAAYVDDEALRLLAFRLVQQASHSTTNPEVYDVSAEIIRFGTGGLLIINMIIAPAHADRWAERIRGTVRELAGRPLDDRQFGELHRRYRGERLRALANPEARALDAAHQLIFGGQFRAPAQRTAALAPNALSRAAQQLRDPAITIVGPR
jgi:predicted Zn-dependent peptidase